MTTLKNIQALERYESLIDHWEDFQAALTRPLPVCVWTNTTRTSAEEVFDHLQQEGLSPLPLPWYPGAFEVPAGSSPGNRLPYLAGLYHVQEAVSLLPVVLLDPQPGEMILDLCAAPGNKTAQIAVAMHNRGTIIANDLSGARMGVLKTTLSRLGLVNTVTTLSDASDFQGLPNSFDRVLADVPCSCEGTTRKYPGALRNAGPDQSRYLATKQRSILERAVTLCNPGGHIVYSTCTFAPEENEMVVDHVLEKYGSSLRLLPARIDQFVSSPGITQWNDKMLSDTLSRTLRVWPHQNDTGGFFVAVFEKTTGSTQEAESKHTLRRPTEADRKDLSNAEKYEWIKALEYRFGIPPEAFDRFHIFQSSPKNLSIASTEIRIPEMPPADSVGIAFLRTHTVFPKLTSAAVMLLGLEATKNVFDANREAADAFLSRQSFPLTAHNIQNYTGPGDIIVRFGNTPLGLGLFRANEETSGTLESLYPRAWALK